MHFFLCTKEKSAKKEVCQRAVGSPLTQASEYTRIGYRPRKFQPHLTHELSVQMGCHREIAGAPNHRFFPTGCVRADTKTHHAPCAPRAIYFFVGTGVLDCPPCAWGFPSAHKLHVPTFGSGATKRLPPHIMPTRKAFRVQKVGGLPTTSGGGARVQTIRAQTPSFTSSARGGVARPARI